MWQQRGAGGWGRWTEGRMRNGDMSSDTAGEIGGGMSSPLLHYCSVYLVSPLNHCGPTKLEGQTHRNTCVIIYLLVCLMCAIHIRVWIEMWDFKERNEKKNKKPALTWICLFLLVNFSLLWWTHTFYHQKRTDKVRDEKKKKRKENEIEAQKHCAFTFSVWCTVWLIMHQSVVSASVLAWLIIFELKLRIFLNQHY